MTDVSRRDLVTLGACAAVVGGAASSSIGHAAESPLPGTRGATTMEIQRFGITEPGLQLGEGQGSPRITDSSIAKGDIPVISLVTVHKDIVYLCGITAGPDQLGDVKDQTTQVLDRIDRLLHRSGTDKSKLLTAQVWLADMADFADHNVIWNAWVDAKNPPVRCCVQSPRLWRPGMLVEIMATAAR
jgi:enamine deaminase RidA (YjgF/YER057c/UK114 family)